MVSGLAVKEALKGESGECSVPSGGSACDMAIGMKENTRGDGTSHTTHPQNVGELHKFFEASRFEVPAFPLCVLASLRLCVKF